MCRLKRAYRSRWKGGETLYLQVISTNTYITYFYSNILISHFLQTAIHIKTDSNLYHNVISNVPHVYRL